MAQNDSLETASSGEQRLREAIDEVLGLKTNASTDIGADEQAQKNTTQSSGNKYHLRDYSQQQKNNYMQNKKSSQLSLDWLSWDNYF